MGKKTFSKIIAISVISIGIGSVVGTLATRQYYKNKMLHEKISYNPDNMPDKTDVKLDSTNLPIVLINTKGEHVKRDEYITAQMTIIDNGEELKNYSDTVKHSDQIIDYEGLIALRYRGQSSYVISPKKAYAIRALDKPLAEGGKKKKSKLLGMRKGKKWALNHVRIDRSMIRDALSYELARPYMEFVPQVRFCEVIVDGIYRGIYLLSEQITADRLKLEKPGENGDSITGGYILEIDKRNKGEAYPSKHWNISFLFKHPDYDKLSPHQKAYIGELIDKIENSLINKKWRKLEKLIDIQSMIDYQLISEFSSNHDSYDLSTYLYKRRNDDDARIKFCIWDFDVTYGNNRLLYNDRVYSLRKHWWSTAMEDSVYVKKLRQRWNQYRETTFSDEHIEHIVDSLTTQLSICGAEKRNSEAWMIWDNHGDWRGPKRIACEKYMSVSYEDEIEFLKEWIRKRLKWMDQISAIHNRDKNIKIKK